MCPDFSRAVGGSFSESSELPSTVVDAAIDWAVKLEFNSPTEETRRAFEQWLQAAPMHVEAWRRLQLLRSDFAALPPLLALDTLQAAARFRRRRMMRRRLRRFMAWSIAAATLGWQVGACVPR